MTVTNGKRHRFTDGGYEYWYSDDGTVMYTKRLGSDEPPFMQLVEPAKYMGLKELPPVSFAISLLTDEQIDDILKQAQRILGGSNGKDA